MTTGTRDSTARRRRGVSLPGGALVGLLAVGTLGCALHSRAPFDPAAASPPDQAIQQTAPFFQYRREPVTYENHLVEVPGLATHTMRRIQFPSAGDNAQPGNLVTGDYYQAVAQGPRRLVIVLPIWGASTYPPERITRSLVWRLPDTHVLHLTAERRLFVWEEFGELMSEAEVRGAIYQYAERIRTTVIDIRRTLDWAEARSEIDPDRIGIIGFSIGAFVASVAVANEPRLSAAVLAMGAADAAEVLATCPGRRGRARESILRRFGWSVEDYRDLIADAFDTLDRAYLPGRVDPRRVLIFDGRLDRCMPASTREELWERMGRPERISYYFGHRGSFVAMTPLGLNHMRTRIVRFLDQTL